MRFKRKRPTGWYRWFAWYPVETLNGIVWLEYVYRIGVHVLTDTAKHENYRAIDKDREKCAE